MLTHFPQAVPEIPVTNVDTAAAYYVDVLGFSFDWGNDEGGIGGISQGDCRMFLTNAPFRAVHGLRSPVIVWLSRERTPLDRRHHRPSSWPDAECTTHGDELADVVGRVVGDEQDGTQVRLP